MLEHFNLRLRPGERAAIVGKSGSGKSAVVKLLQGLYTPDSGRVTIDGLDPASLDSAVFVSSIGCANQKPCFFAASIRDNLTLWDTGVSEAAVYNAVKDAGLHSFITGLEGAYDYILPENGRSLSGGQQQRLEIARALLYNPSILILDEVNSAIDPPTLALIERNFARRGCAVVQTTRLLSPVTDYDVIILMDAGHIVDQGTHRALLERSSLYAALYNEGEII